MTDFDPYYKWLGIPPDEQPANYYRLIGVRIFESDAGVITNAADQRMAFLRTLQLGNHGSLAERLLNEVSRAHVTLSDESKRVEYDQGLLARQSPGQPAKSLLPCDAANAASPATLTSDPAPNSLSPSQPLSPRVLVGGAGILVLTLLAAGLGARALFREQVSRPSLRASEAERGPDSNDASLPAAAVGPKEPHADVDASPQIAEVQEDPSSIGAERDAAGYLCRAGGRVGLMANDATRWKFIRSVGEFPDEHHVREVDLSGVSSIRDVDLARLRAFPRLTLLRLKGPAISDAGLEHLANLTNLEFLELKSTKVTGYGLKHLNRSKLKQLYLEGSPADSEQLRCLESLPSLHTLSLNETPVSDESLSHVARLPNIQNLHLRNAGITDDGLAYLKAAASLRNLGLEGNPVTYRGLLHLQFLELEVLNLSKTGVGADLSPLENFRNLQNLFLSGTRVSDESMHHLGNLPSLKILDLSSLPISDDGAAHLQTLTDLERLDLSRTRVSGATLATISKLSKIDHLSLAGTQISDEGVSHLATLPNLIYLDCSDTAITDQSAHYFSRFPSLKYLDLNSTEISDGAVENLHKLAGLRRLGVLGTRLSEGGAAELRRALSQCSVSYAPRAGE